MKLIEQIRKNFAANANRSLEVPEWNTTVYAAPMTFAEWQRVNAFAGDDNHVRAISVIIEKCRDQDGERLFESDAQTRATLEGGADSAVLSRVFLWLTSAPEMEAEKNA